MKNWLKVALSALAVFILAACGNSTGSEGTEESVESTDSEVVEETTVTVGVVGDIDNEIWEDIASRLEPEGIILDLTVFGDYVQPNVAVNEGSLELNAFQHMAYLAEFNAGNDANLTPIGFTYVSPMAAYSNEYENIEDVPEGAKVALPNDVTNGGRALILLEIAGLITLDEAAGITPAVDDILENPKNLQFEQVDAAQVPRVLDDVDLAVSNTNYALDAGLNPYEDGIFVDTDDLSTLGAQYKNVIVAHPDHADNPVYARIVEEYQSDATVEKLKEVSADQPAWSEDDDIAASFAEVTEITTNSAE